METKALLFDFDGVVCDTESIYSVFWNSLGKKYLGIDDLGKRVKGTTLTQILSKHFSEKAELVDVIMDGLDSLEKTMSYDYLPGVCNFLNMARNKGYKLAVVTSSNLPKMRSVYGKRPELLEMFDIILTSEDFTASKPDPECYLKAMECFGTDAAHSVVFEDSIYGLQAGKSSGAFVIGLTTTNPLETVKLYSNLQFPDFKDAEAIFDAIEAYMSK